MSELLTKAILTAIHHSKAETTIGGICEYIEQHYSTQMEMDDVENYVEDLIDGGLVKGTVVRTLGGNAYIIKRLTISGRSMMEEL